MFTGLIRHLGTMDVRTPRAGGARIRIRAPKAVMDIAQLGSSICTNGVCLTVVARHESAWEADVSEETLNRTTLGMLERGALLHLEPSLRVGDPLDGHLVSGHVDGVGHLVDRPAHDGLWTFSFPQAVAPMIASKGSIAVDGLSLTVVDVVQDHFTVALIPETVRCTRLKDLPAGAAVNLEVDPLGRFVARSLALMGQELRLESFAQRGWGPA